MQVLARNAVGTVERFVARQLLLDHLLRSHLIPPAYVYPSAKRPLRALLRQRIFYVWRRAERLARIHSHH